MKHVYYVVVYKDGDLYAADAETVRHGENLMAIFANRSCLHAVYSFETATQARYTAEAWNEGYKGNGCYLFSDRPFANTDGYKMWREGDISLNGVGYSYCAKVYETGSPYGINLGRISKLTIYKGDNVVANYDRGWDELPADDGARAALVAILEIYK